MQPILPSHTQKIRTILSDYFSTKYLFSICRHIFCINKLLCRKSYLGYVHEFCYFLKNTASRNKFFRNKFVNIVNCFRSHIDELISRMVQQSHFFSFLLTLKKVYDISVSVSSVGREGNMFQFQEVSKSKEMFSIILKKIEKSVRHLVNKN